MKKYLILACCLEAFYCGAQTPYPLAPAASGAVTRIEYFIDSRPGFGSGTALTGFGSSTDIANFNGAISLAGLPQGLHRIYLRSQDADGKWSLTHSAFFDNFNVPLYASAPAAPDLMNRIEYFIDSRPLFGAGTALTGFPFAGDISNYSGAVDLTGVPGGLHRFYIRSRDAGGRWSLTNNSFLDNFSTPLYAAPAAGPINMVQLEYFIDNTDPGFGHATPIPITPNSDIANLSANINVTGLPGGIHRLFIRGKDADQKWSITSFSLFDNTAVPPYPDAPAAAPALSTIEYFIDNDPGFGNGSPLAVPANAGQVGNYSVSINLSGNLSGGIHYLYIRSRQNPWSMTNVIPFSATAPLPLVWSYVKAELVNDQTLVSWATVQESHTQKFEVEHSTGGSIFTKIGELPAAGNSSTIRQYSFPHVHPVTGFNYYRIRQIDLDGTFKYSPVVVVLKRAGLSGALIAPNPVKDVLHVVEEKEVFVSQAEIYSVDGKLELRKAFKTGLEVYSIPVSQLARGTYFLKVTYKDHTKLYKFIKD